LKLAVVEERREVRNEVSSLGVRSLGDGRGLFWVVVGVGGEVGFRVRGVGGRGLDVIVVGVVVLMDGDGEVEGFERGG